MKPRIKVVSTGRYIPEKILTNDDLSKMVETSDEWIKSRTGIEKRHQATFETNADMAYFSAKNALDKKGYDVSKIDLIIVATMTNDLKNPSVANMVQAKLGLNDKKVMAFDINAACTGFIYALDVASNLINSNRFRSALVIGSEKMSHILDYSDRNTCVLFGDGAGAVIIEPSQDPLDTIHFYNDSRGDDELSLYVDETLKMDGKKVYQFAVDIVPKAVLEIIKISDKKIDEIDMIIPHQANKRIIESVSKHLKIDMDKFFLNIQKYGNTSAASIPIALDEYKNQNPDQKNVLLVGFGGGLTWGSTILKI